MNEIQQMNVETIVGDAIQKLLGDISNLPDAARKKIHQVYQEFYDAYLKIANLKGVLQNSENFDAVDFDPDIIEFMQHFFSDYQNIYREFKATNRHTKVLIQIDRNKNPEEFESQLNVLISGKNDFTEESVIEKILKVI